MKLLRLTKGLLAINPDFAEAYYNLGTVLQEQSKSEEAIKAYKKQSNSNLILPRPISTLEMSSKIMISLLRLLRPIKMQF